MEFCRTLEPKRVYVHLISPTPLPLHNPTDARPLRFLKTCPPNVASEFHIYNIDANGGVDGSGEEWCEKVRKGVKGENECEWQGG